MIEHNKRRACALLAIQLSAGLCHHLLPIVAAVFRPYSLSLKPLPSVMAIGFHSDKASHGKCPPIGLFTPNLSLGAPN
jgi:hypothetical protein